MSKAKFIEIVDGRPPKRFCMKMETHEQHSWTPEVLMQWVHEFCTGVVWYEHFEVKPWLRHNGGAHMVLRVWFSKRKDAMLYKLINMTA